MNQHDSGGPRSPARRNLLRAGATGAVTLAASGALSRPAHSAAQAGDANVSVAIDGKYETVPLRADVLRVTAVQSIMRAIRDTKNPKREMQANLQHMIDLIDAANGFPGRQHLVCFNEQPLSGWNTWTREESLRISIEVPGPETEALGAKAKQYGCYITFGAYVRDRDWPGHLLLNGILIGPDGKVVANHWKTNNMRGFRPDWDIFTTSIYDVLDRYREMYGEDEVLSIARTDIGNISCSVTPGQPDIVRAMAMKGLELRLSSSSGGYNVEEAQLMSAHNRLWTVVCNQSVSPETLGFPEFSGAGDTAIFGPNGKAAARARSVHEEFVTTAIPIAEFRRTRSIPPGVPMEMLLPVYTKYAPRHGANMHSSYIPADSADASRYYASRKNW
ncbi:MAG TPA: nitrilase-related carbon-nitrogen hydrolase [Steroidobacter sp.]|uniref:nitrilase-related carbon-nitrogen hydrolase n=1 Tax=Steroidobacter sp. TaxID=1978227 RepID=UPI002EDA6BA0